METTSHFSKNKTNLVDKTSCKKKKHAVVQRITFYAKICCSQ